MKKILLRGVIFKISKNHGLAYSYKIETVNTDTGSGSGSYLQIRAAYKNGTFHESKNVTINANNIEIFTYFGGMLLSNKISFK